MKAMLTLMLALLLVLPAVAGCAAPSAIPVKQGITAPPISSPAAQDALQTAVLQKKTEHFRIFCGSHDVLCVEDLAEGLESAYVKVTADFDRPLDDPVTVTVCPNLKELHRAIGYNEGSAIDDYITAATIGNNIFAVSPLNPGPVRSYDHIIHSSTMHEFTHVIINDLAGSDSWPVNIPRWLNEGLACYEGGPPMDVSAMKSNVSWMVMTGKVPSYETMCSYGQIYNNAGCYFVAWPAGQYYVDTFGFGKIKQYIQSPDDFRDIFGKTEDEVWADFNQYLLMTYR